MRKIASTLAVLVLLSSTAAYAGGEEGHGHGHGHHGHGHYSPSPNSDRPPSQDKPKQQAKGDRQLVQNYLVGVGVCNLTGHFFDTFIRDRGQYQKDGKGKHVKRTYGDQAAVIGNCFVPFIGGLIARRLTGDDENKPLPFYTDDSWMFTKNHSAVN